MFEFAFASIIARDRWISWVPVPNPDPTKKPIKRPLDPRRGIWSSAMDPSTWLTFAEARSYGYPIGYVLGDGEHFCLDLDECGDTHPWIERLPGAALERSHSGMGLHVWGRAREIGLLQHGCRNSDHHAELYTRDRFIAMGTPISGSSHVDCTDALRALIVEHFPPSPAVTGESTWTEAPVPTWTGPVDDERLIERAKATRSIAAAFGSAASFGDLWDNNEEALATAFPSATDVYDRSRADAALAAHLAFWTGKNCERIERLMFASSLVRDKWQRQDYIRGTILRAVATTTKVYDVQHDASPATSVITAPVEGDASTDHIFDDHYYVVSKNRVLCPDGSVLTEASFNGLHAHRHFTLPRDKKGTWKAFTALIKYPSTVRVHDTIFYPITTERLVTLEDTTYANTWRGILTPRFAGRPDRWIEHVRMMYSPLDAEILIAAFAGHVQYVGLKSPWAIIQQGIQGNGKSTITRGLCNVFGNKYVTKVRPTQIGAQFNSQLVGKLLAVIDDVNKVRVEALEALKTLITDDRIEVEKKGVDAADTFFYANWIINTNHADAIPINRDDRRYAVLVSKQQNVSDLAIYPPGHFDALRAFVASDEGAAKLHDFLATYSIPVEFDFTKGCGRAPATTFEQTALVAGYSPLAQEIHEAVGRRQLGFRSGWISSVHVDELVRRTGVYCSPWTKNKALRDLGYRKIGKVGRAPACDPGRTTLWVKSDQAPISESEELADETIRRYEIAQDDKAENTGPTNVIPFFPPS